MSSDVAVYLTYNQTGTWDFRPLVQTSAVTSFDDHQRIVLDGKVHLPAMYSMEKEAEARSKQRRNKRKNRDTATSSREIGCGKTHLYATGSVRY